VREAAAEHSLTAWFYDEYYQAVQHSPAHALFCERAYGRDLAQHGVADMEQLALLQRELLLQPGMTLLDFGCGDGRIAEYIADTTGALVSGVDIAPRAIELATERTRAKRDRLRFSCADVERQRGTFPDGRFDRICAIDSIFFARDQQAVLRALLDHLAPAGRMGLFFLGPTNVPADATVLAEALRALSLPYTAHDLSAHNREHARRKRAILEELTPLFQAEGSEFLLRNRLADCEGLDQYSRFLYLTTNRLTAGERQPGATDRM
jgi:SAM-dependent methyltransferase